MPSFAATYMAWDNPYPRIRRFSTISDVSSSCVITSSRPRYVRLHPKRLRRGVSTAPVDGVHVEHASCKRRDRAALEEVESAVLPGTLHIYRRADLLLERDPQPYGIDDLRVLHRRHGAQAGWDGDLGGAAINEDGHHRLLANQPVDDLRTP